MRSRIRVVGGAPPPPLGAAPQGAKNPEKFGPKWAGFGRVAATEDHAQSGGWRGLQPATRSGLRGEADGPPGPGRRWQQSLPPPQARDRAIRDRTSEESGGE